MKTKDETKTDIIEAADARFQKFGYGKTTMAEIAKDCGMSAANLYRFFESKSDIAAAFAVSHFSNEEKILREVVRKPGVSAASKVEGFIQATLDITYDFAANNSNINQLVDSVCAERCDMLRKHIELRQGLMTEILAEGNRTGEFAIDDVVSASTSVLKASIFFDFPTFMIHHSKEELDGYIEGVVSLILNGLNKR